MTGEPGFLELMKNETVVKGREAILRCRVTNLAGYKVS
jgi:hypothetical protein